MGKDDVSKVVTKEQEKLFTVVCIHCEKTTFSFSVTTLDGMGDIRLECPHCGKFTYYNRNEGIR